MIIDAHVHLDLKRFKGVKDAAKNLIKDMDSAKIAKAILVPDNYLNRNEHIKEACRLFPKRFYGYGMVNPKQNKQKIKKDIDKLAGNKWFKGIKIHPRMQNFTLDKPGVFHIAHCIGLYNLPLNVDCLPVFKFTGLDEGVFPNAFDKLAKANPATNIVILHMGGHRLMDAFSIAAGNPNIFLEVAYTFYKYKGSSVEKDMAFAIKNVGPQRVIYGTDHPSISMRGGLEAFNKFCNRYRIAYEARRDMFCNTVSKLIHLGGE